MKAELARIVRLQNSLHADASGAPKPGYSANRWGTYWRSDLVDEIIAIRSHLRASEENPDEWNALSVAQIGTLVAAMRLDAAREVCGDLLKRFPERVTNVKRELAYIEALSGNGEIARALAEEVNAAAIHAFQRVVAADLEREIEFGASFSSQSEPSARSD